MTRHSGADTMLAQHALDAAGFTVADVKITKDGTGYVVAWRDSGEQIGTISSRCGMRFSTSWFATTPDGTIVDSDGLPRHGLGCSTRNAAAVGLLLAAHAKRQVES